LRLSLGGLGRLVLRQGLCLRLRLCLVDGVGLGLLCQQGLRLGPVAAEPVPEVVAW
jgi:hypothetical protein